LQGNIPATTPEAIDINSSVGQAIAMLSTGGRGSRIPNCWPPPRAVARAVGHGEMARRHRCGDKK
jgi:hypothetical protein